VAALALSLLASVPAAAQQSDLDCHYETLPNGVIFANCSNSARAAAAAAAGGNNGGVTPPGATPQQPGLGVAGAISIQSSVNLPGGVNQTVSGNQGVNQQILLQGLPPGSGASTGVAGGAGHSGTNATGTNTGASAPGQGQGNSNPSQNSASANTSTSTNGGSGGATAGAGGVGVGSNAGGN
jgi:hypothetical protein